jgi:hypothetical protein
MFGWLSELIELGFWLLIFGWCGVVVAMFVLEWVGGDPGKPSQTNTLGGKHNGQGSR